MKNAQDVVQFEKLEQQIHSMQAEVAELSKKKPNDAVNKFKLKFINQVLGELNEVLGDTKPFEGFAKFDEDDLPTNSDVVMMLAQYSSAAFLFRSNNTGKYGYDWYWNLNGKKSSIETEDPNRFKYEEK